MKTLSHILFLIVGMQLMVGTSIPTAQAQISAAGRVGTAVNATKVVVAAEERMKNDDEKIDNIVSANEYVKNVALQNEVFSAQCYNEKGEFTGNNAFVLDKNIPNDNMNVKNCADEMQKLVHLNRRAEELAKNFQSLKNGSCVSCSVNARNSIENYAAKIQDNQIAAGEKCSIARQKQLSKEPCSTYCIFKPALITAMPLGIVAGLLTKGKDGCPATGPLKDNLECAANLAKGLVKGIWEGFKGLGELLWKGVTLAGSAIKKGAKSLWHALWDTEDASLKSLHACSQVPKKEQEELNKDKEGWIAKKVHQMMDLLKEVIYVGMFERESKCMDCAQKGRLMCEIGGRIAADVVGFSFTLGAGYGAIKTIVAKVAPLLKGTAAAAKAAEEVAAVAARAAEASGEAASAAAKIGAKKSVSWMGKLGIKEGSISKPIAERWSKIQNSARYKSMMNGVSKSGSYLKKGGKAAANTLPGKIVVKVGRAIKYPIKKYIEFDTKIFANGAYAGSRLALGSKTQALRIFSEVAKAGEVGAIAERDGKAYRTAVSKDGSKLRTTQFTKEQLTEEVRAQLSRAKAEIIPVEDKFVVRIPQKNFKKLLNQDFATKIDEIREIPVGADGKVVVKTRDAVITRNVKDIPLEEVEKLKSEGAVFVASDAPEALKPLNAKIFDFKQMGVEVGQDGNIVIESEGKFEIKSADKLSKEEIAKYKKDGAKFSTTDDPDLERRMNIDDEGKAVLEEKAAKTHQLAEEGKGEEALNSSMQDVDQLTVLRDALDVDGSAKAARENLTKAGKVKPSHLEGIENATAIETTREGNGPIHFLTEDGIERTIATKEEGAHIVETYQNGTKAIVRKPNGEISFHDFEQPGGHQVTTLSKERAKLVDEAMGKLPSQKSLDEKAFQELKSNLDVNKTKYEVKIVDGKEQLEIQVPQECRKDGAGAFITVLAK